MVRVKLAASDAAPAPTKPATAGAAAMAKPPSPMVSTIVESPISGLACCSVKPGKYSPSGISTGATNQVSPVPLIRIPKSVPLRDMAVTTQDPSMLRTGSMIDFTQGHGDIEEELVVSADEGQGVRQAQQYPADVRARAGAS